MMQIYCPQIRKLFFQADAKHRQFWLRTALAGIAVGFTFSCATHQAQYGRQAVASTAQVLPKGPPEQTFYLIGDAGNADQSPARATLASLKAQLDQADKSSTLLFLGDNIYPAGLPKKDDPKRALAQTKLDNQLELARDFKGRTFVIPGNHDWYSEGIKGLRRQEDYVNSKTGKNKTFLPAHGCGIDHFDISDNVVLVTVDSQWFMEDWDKNPGINEDCEIKSREAFFAELESQLTKNQKKTIILAIHHPIMSNGVHGGQYSLAKNLFPFQSSLPLPVLGSILNFVRKTSGLNPQDLQNKQYAALASRIRTMLEGRDNVIVVSGHEHNLQLVQKDKLRQVVSGAGSKSEAARAVSPHDFSYGGNGYAVLDLYKRGEAWVSFFGMKQNKAQLLHRAKLRDAVLEKVPDTFPKSFPKQYRASVYSDSLLHKSGFHNFLWGTHYRTYYGTKVDAPTASLDSLYGGLKPVTAGGGHQSMSLRLQDKNGRQFTMRGLRKNAVRFIQTMAFRNQFVERDFRDTYAEDFLLDFYTTSHPYTPFIVGNLADAVQVAHSNPRLFYVPRQETLGEFNAEFGEGLYMIEERPDKGFEKLKSFGKPDAFVNTDDLLQNLHKDEKYTIDEKAYIRARLFDMLIGDWDRHDDQWRWGQYKQGDSIVYRPIPRDRDQAFPKYDGALLWLIMKMPALRHMQSYKDDISNVKWFNMEPYPLDLALLRRATAQDWEAQAEYLAKNLTEAEIDKAFSQLPTEVQDATIAKIKENLKARRGKLKQYAARHYEVLQKTVLVVGTDKKDKFQIKRLKDGKTEIAVFRLKKDGEEAISKRIYDRKLTREIWIYGLDGEDVFEQTGNGSHCILLRLLGGPDGDRYQLENAHAIRIYDTADPQNQLNAKALSKALLTNDYAINQYDFKRPKYNAIAGFPSIGFNPDDGVKLGVSVTYTVNGFKRNPFSQKHNLKANYYFATEGYEFLYKGIFPNIRSDWQFQLDAAVTSPNFSFNFFGYGNETVDRDEVDGMNFNRVKAEILRVSPSLNWKGKLGAFFNAQATVESVEIDRTNDRLIGTPGIVDARVFDAQQFAGASLRYGFENYDNLANPTLGLKMYAEVGATVNLKNTRRNVPYAEAMLGFSHKLLSNGKLVLGSQLKSRLLFSDDYEFYQMATIGGDFDVRAFRTQRFSGKRSFFQSSDLRWQLGKIRKSIAPMRYGLLGGFDYGRVWLPGEISDKWHTAYGGGLWLSGVDIVTAKLNYFYSSDGSRISFGLGFGF